VDPSPDGGGRDVDKRLVGTTVAIVREPLDILSDPVGNPGVPRFLGAILTARVFAAYLQEPTLPAGGPPEGRSGRVRHLVGATPDASHQLNSDLTFPVFTPDGRL